MYAFRQRHVDDVACGHVAALDRDRVGERYFFGWPSTMWRALVPTCQEHHVHKRPRAVEADARTLLRFARLALGTHADHKNQSMFQFHCCFCCHLFLTVSTKVWEFPSISGRASLKIWPHCFSSFYQLIASNFAAQSGYASGKTGEGLGYESKPLKERLDEKHLCGSRTCLCSSTERQDLWSTMKALFPVSIWLRHNRGFIWCESARSVLYQLLRIQDSSLLSD